MCCWVIARIGRCVREIICINLGAALLLLAGKQCRRGMTDVIWGHKVHRMGEDGGFLVPSFRQVSRLHLVLSCLLTSSSAADYRRAGRRRMNFNPSAVCSKGLEAIPELILLESGRTRRSGLRKIIFSIRAPCSI